MRILTLATFIAMAMFVSNLRALAQGNPTTTPPSTANTSTAGSTSIIYDSGGTVPRQFITPIPGVTGTPGVFPGIPYSNSRWMLWRSAVMSELTMEEIDKMKAGRRNAKKMRTSRLDSIPANKDPIKMVSYWPGVVINPGDKVLGEVTVTGYFIQPDIAVLATGLAEAKHLTGTRRVAVRVRGLNETVTDGKSIGGSASFGRITQPGADNDVIGAAVGGLLGTNRVGMQDYPEFDILCLNDGPTDLPPPPIQRAATQPAIPVPPTLPPPPVLDVRVHLDPIQVQVPPIQIVLPDPIDHSIFPVVAPPVQSPTSTASQVAEVCDSLPNFVVYFEFDKSIVRDEYLPKIKEITTWLGAHQNCHIQVEGYTCRSGSATYDAGLGLRRADAVYKQLLAVGGKPEQIKKTLSGGKERLASEYEPRNRRVILSILGASSGK